MSQGLSLNLGQKEYAALAKPLARDAQENPNAKAEAAKITNGPERATSLKWKTEVDNNGKEHIGLSQPDTAIVSSVVLSNSVRAPGQAPALRQHLTKLKQKFVDLFKESCGKSSHSNRLIAKLAEFTASINAAILMRAGMSPEDIQTLREEVRQESITQNQVSLEQVQYDKSMLKVLG